MTTNDGTTGRHLQTLGQFVARARRVEGHSLAVDKNRLSGWARGEFTVSMGPDEATMSRELPEEEALESLAARCRPLILQADSIHYTKVTRALGFFIRDDVELATHLKHFRESFQVLDPNSRETLGYSIQVENTNGGFSPLVTDKQLAFAWLYSDLVHADELVPPIDHHYLNARYEAAVLYVANVAVTAVSVHCRASD